MALFQFGRKFEFVKEYSLDDIPVFSSLSPSEQRLIEKKARLVEYKRGDIVYEEATPSEAFYVVISGRFRLYARPKQGKAEETLIYFYRGDHFGEASLLTGRLHSACVEAKRDGLILKFEKEDFLKLIQEIPAISRHLNRSLGHRLTKVADTTTRREVKIVAFFSKGQGFEGFQFWADLCGALAGQGKRKVLMVDLGSEPPGALFSETFQGVFPGSLDLERIDGTKEPDLRTYIARHPSGFDYFHARAGEQSAKIPALLIFLASRFEDLMVRLPPEMNDATFRAMKHSDAIYILTGQEPAELPGYGQVLQDFEQSFGFSKNEIRVILPDPETSGTHPLTFEQKEGMLGSRVFSVLPSRTGQPERYQKTLRYIAKELSGTLLGLALGSGAAYGLAHIGVLRALEKEGIQVDMIAGCSIGALVGAFWAAGFSTDQLESLAKSMDRRTSFFRLLGFRDMALAHRGGFFKGHQVSRFMESYLGDKTFRDLEIPVKVIAADLFTSEEVVLESGRLVDAIRASISIPGIFIPVIHRDQCLIDGGVVDPLPVRVLSSLGIKKIIAVNVLPGPKDRLEKHRVQIEEEKLRVQLQAEKGYFKRFVAKGMHKVYNRYAVNTFNIIVNTIQFLEYEIAESWGHQADILIHAVAPEAHWAEFYSPEKFIRVGEQKTREQMDEIKRLLTE